MTLSNDLDLLANYRDDSPARPHGQAYEDFLENFDSQVDPLGLYCLVTGKQIGSLNYSELVSFIDSHPDTDPEELADDYRLRLAASMRPSIHWNVMREETLDTLLRTQPTETFAYLVNRLLAPEGFRAIPFAQRIESLLDRIATYRAIESWRHADESGFTKCLHMLVEIDSKVTLDKLPQPFTASDFINCQNRVELLAPWYTDQCRKHIERVELAKKTANWERHGNPLMSHAATKLMQEIQPSKARIEKQAKAEEAGFFANLFDEITSGKTVVETKTPAEVKPSPVGFKLKLNLGGKK